VRDTERDWLSVLVWNNTKYQRPVSAALLSARVLKHRWAKAGWNRRIGIFYGGMPDEAQECSSGARVEKKGGAASLQGTRVINSLTAHSPLSHSLSPSVTSRRRFLSCIELSGKCDGTARKISDVMDASVSTTSTASSSHVRNGFDIVQHVRP
jgi:hypothetical protein